MMKFNGLVILFIMSFLIISCSGNSIYYDLEVKGVISCDNFPISRITIDGGTGENSESYYITSDVGVSIFTPNNISKEFIIRDIKDKIIANESFKLKPLSVYKISNISIGDAAEQWLTVKTDNYGVIKNADKISCDN